MDNGLKVGDEAIVCVDSSHRLADYNGRIVQIAAEQPKLKWITEPYVIMSLYDDAYNTNGWGWGFANCCHLNDLIPLKEGLAASMLACMKRVAAVAASRDATLLE